MNPLPVSIITVCKNAIGDLLRTEASVRQQQPGAFEWIIIDGASSDGTQPHLERFSEEWIRWISEPDRGIYDAMNRGLALARGNWVWFMNAGDTFSDGNALNRLLTVPFETDIVYGEAQIVDRDGALLGTRSEVTPHVLPQQLEKSCFRYGMVVSHQAFIVKRAIAPFYKTPPYRLSADLDWMLTLLDCTRSSRNLGLIATVTRHGATMDHWYRSQFERFLILGRHFGYAQAVSSHFLIALRRIRHGLRGRFWR